MARDLPVPDDAPWLDCMDAFKPMTETWSPATQAVINASNCPGSKVVQLHIADALRAAAEQLTVTNGECPGVTLWEQGFLAGAAGAQQALRVIADELDPPTQ